MQNSIHRERFALAMRHKEADKVPSDLWLDSSDPASIPSFAAYLGVKSYQEILNLLDVDIYRFKSPVKSKIFYHDGSLATYFLPPPHDGFASFSNDSAIRPFLGLDDPKKLDEFVWPTADIYDYDAVPDIMETQKHRILWAQGGTWSPMFCKMCDFCGIEKVLMDMALNEDFILAMRERILAFYRENFRRTLEAGKGNIDVFCFGDDIATQQRLMFSKDMWNLFYRDPMTELCGLIHSYGAKVAFHSCGAVGDLIPEFIEAGVDILFPIQPRAEGMSPERLKRDFGGDIVFYGGIDVQHILPFGTEEEVRENVSDTIDILAKDGGYIVASAHGIMRDVPKNNILAMYDEIKRHPKPL